MLAEFSLVRFQVQTGKRGEPPLMVLPRVNGRKIASRILLPKKAQSAPPQSKALPQAPILSPHQPTTPCWAGRPNRALG